MKGKIKKIIIVIVLLAAGTVTYSYLSDYYQGGGEEQKAYTEEDFPRALNMMDEEVLRLSLEDLNNQYQELAKGDHIYIRWINIGILKKRLGDPRGAEEAWQAAISVNPKRALAFGNLAGLYFHNLKEYEKAEENYLKAISLMPDYYSYYVDLADLYKGKLTDKRNLIEDLINDGAEESFGVAKADYYLYLAHYFSREGDDLEKAKEYSQKALKANSNIEDQLPEL